MSGQTRKKSSKKKAKKIQKTKVVRSRKGLENLLVKLEEKTANRICLFHFKPHGVSQEQLLEEIQKRVSGKKVLLAKITDKEPLGNQETVDKIGNNLWVWRIGYVDVDVEPTIVVGFMNHGVWPELRKDLKGNFLSK